MINADVRVGDVVRILHCACEACRVARSRPYWEEFDPSIIENRRGDFGERPSMALETRFPIGSTVRYVGKSTLYNQHECIGSVGIVEKIEDNFVWVVWIKWLTNGAPSRGLYPDNIEVVCKPPL